MKKTIFFIGLCIGISSCASIFNGPTAMSTLYTSSPAKIIIHSDTLETINNKVNFVAERSKDTLEVKVISDTIHKQLHIAPVNSRAYKLSGSSFFIIGPFALIPAIIDKKKDIRYNYPPKIYVNTTDSISEYAIYDKITYKGDLLLHVSLPHVNSFIFKPKDEPTASNTGFHGISLGLDYFHSNRQYLNLSGTGVMGFMFPLPATFHWSGNREIMNSTFLTLSNNHKIQRLSIGYGLTYARNSWELRRGYYTDDDDFEEPLRDPITKTNKTIGFVFPVYYQTGKHFNLGLIYRPTFIVLNSVNTFQYEHLISLDLAWKVRLRR